MAIFLGKKVVKSMQNDELLDALLEDLRELMREREEGKDKEHEDNQ